MRYELYLVGGYVRDKFLGVHSKDIDYSVVIPDQENFSTPEEALVALQSQLKEDGFEIFLVTPDCFTIRAKFPKGHKESGTADFVLARKEIGYIPGTRTPKVVLGSLRDDLVRRDFTVNAMAIDSNGKLIDFYGGQEDLIRNILRTPTDTFASFNDDPLRLIRALRFAVTKSFGISDDIMNTIKIFDSGRLSVVSTERIREELLKMFKANTKQTLRIFRWLEDINAELYSDILSRDIWLKPTNEQ